MQRFFPPQTESPALAFRIVPQPFVLAQPAAVRQKHGAGAGQRYAQGFGRAGKKGPVIVVGNKTDLLAFSGLGREDVSFGQGVENIPLTGFS